MVVAKAIGISLRQLYHWVDVLQVVRPKIQSHGKRQFRHFTPHDVKALQAIRQLLDAGYTLRAAVSKVTMQQGCASVPHRPASGFTLLELQVAIALFLFATSSLAIALMNDLSQVRWLEQRRQLYAFIPQTLPDPPLPSKAIFTELTSTAQPSGAVNRVTVKSYSETGTKLMAKVLLEAR